MTLWIEDYFSLAQQLQPLLPEIQKALVTFERLQGDPEIKSALKTAEKVVGIFNSLPKRET